MKRPLSLLAILILALGTFANYNPNHPPNTYQSPENPNYWKNKMPKPGYWQQDVHYRMDIVVDEKTDILHGKTHLTYWNHSPDTLSFVYFHLYQNAFQPGSYYHNLHLNNGVKPTYGDYEASGLGTVIQYMQSAEKELETHLDNTILKVMLDEPLAPGESIDFFFGFKTYYDNGSIRRRMKQFESYGHKQFNGAHWYPRLSVYDKKFGWTTDQHLGREFYGDFGTFDVKLTFASNYVVGATGLLQNSEEVLPDELMQKLDVKNFADKEWGSEPSEIIPYVEGETKTWHFYAENVHDFAFTANPNYRIGVAEWNGIKAYSFVQEPHASKWQNAADYTAEILEVFSEDFGMYIYPKMIVADARDGMEYPMLTLDNGKDPTYRGLLVHEVGHNWFYGMLGNNETYRAALDEGFTQFLTAWGLEAIDGEYLHRSPISNAYTRMFKDSVRARDSRVYYPYLRDAIKADDQPLNTHSDHFHGKLRHGGGYRHVYYKMATMLYNLEYTLGDSLFLGGMQHYVQDWMLCHPYFEDFRQSMTDYTKTDLNWFFDQWLTTTKSIDYSVDYVKRGALENEYLIGFKRHGEMQMPIDFRVHLDDGTYLDYHIPNNYFIKKTDATVLPKWTGWQNLFPEHEASVIIPGNVVDVEIDPSQRLADINMVNNRKKFKPDVRFDALINNRPSWRNYEMKYGPNIWYNAYDGVKVGAHLKGSYMNFHHKFDATVWYSTRWGQGGYYTFADELAEENRDISVVLNYSTSIDKILNNGKVQAHYRFLDGLEVGQLGIHKSFENEASIKLNYKYLFRPETTDLLYLLYPGEWTANQYNSSLNLGFFKGFDLWKSHNHFKLNLRSSSLFSDYDYHTIDAELITKRKIGKLDIRKRLYAQYGTGSNIAPESMLFFSGANPEEMMENAYTRSIGFVPDEWVGTYGVTTNHFHHGGGLNMRGYAGYLLAQDDSDGSTLAAYKGISGASINVEIGFDRLIPLKAKKLSRYFGLDTYIFGDAGTIMFDAANGNERFSDVRFDAGAGAALTIKRFWMLEQTNPLTIRFDMPFLLSHTPNQDPDYLQFRYVVGINRAF